MKRFSPYQFMIFRFLVGSGFFLYFLLIFPYAPDLTETRTLGLRFGGIGLPTIFSFMRSVGEVRFSMMVMASLSALMALGVYRRWIAAILLFAFANTISIIPLFPTPEDGFAGFALLIAILVPGNEAFTLFPMRNKWRPNEKFFHIVLIIFALTSLTFGLWQFLRFWRALTHLAVMACFFYTLLGALLLFRPTRLFGWCLGFFIILLFPASINFGLYFVNWGVFFLCLDSNQLFPWQKNVRKPADIFIDGECVLCNGFAEFILAEDKHRFFRIASLQGTHARTWLPPRVLGKVSTVIFKDGDHIYEKSGAVLRIIGRLGGIWTCAYALLLIPYFLRDMAYNVVAYFRYKVFGQYDQCRLPTPEERERVLD